MIFATIFPMNKNYKFLSFLMVAAAISVLLITAGCKPEPPRKTLLGTWTDQHKMTWEFKKGGTLIMTQQTNDEPITSEAHFEVLDELSFRMVLYPDTEEPITKKVRYKLELETLDLTIENFGEKKGAVFNLTRTVDGEKPAEQPKKPSNKKAGFFNQTLRNHYADKYLATVLMRAVFKEINSLPGSK